MSYVLINGKRYYKDDRSGQVILDDVSQEVAEHRGQVQRTVITPPSMQTHSPPVEALPQRARRSEPLNQLIGLFNRMVRTAAVAVAVSSMLLIGVSCIEEPVQFQASFHYELRGIAVRLDQAGDRLLELFDTERRMTND